MRMKQLMSRAKKYAKTRARQARRLRTRTAAAALGIVLGVTGAYAASRLGAPSPVAAKPSDAAVSQRVAENRKAAAELATPAADYAGASSPVAARTPPATLTGCLEQRGDEFRLKDAAGADAPKSRSWKSGFLKKSTPTIDVVDSGNHVKLQDHVGQRVSVSGTLVDRQMRVKTLKGVGSCN